MKWIVIGCGMIGQTHVRALQTLGQEIALCDCVLENANQTGRAFGVSEIYTDYKKAVCQADAQAAIVCSPNHLHAEQSVYAMTHGLHVLCEKPMADTSSQARAILQTMEATGQTLMIGYVLRAGAVLPRVKELLDCGVLGRVWSARCVLAAPETLDDARSTYRRSYETGGGILYDYTHEIDYIRYLLGEPQKGVCFCGRLCRTAQSADDSADSLLQWANGTVAHLHMDYLQQDGRGRGRCFELVCEKGFLSCDFKSIHVFYSDGHVLQETFPSDWDTPFARQLQRFMDLCQGKQVCCATGADGVRVMEIADALYVSARGNCCADLSCGRSR